MSARFKRWFLPLMAVCVALSCALLAFALAQSDAGASALSGESSEGALRQNLWLLALGFAVLLVALTIAVVTTYLYHAKLITALRDLYLCGFLLASGLWFALDESHFLLLLPHPLFVRTLRALSLGFMPVFLMRYTLPMIAGKRFKLCGHVLLITMALLIAGDVLQGAGAVELSALTLPILMATVAGTSVYFVCLILECRGDRVKRRECLPFFVLYAGFLADVIGYLFATHALGRCFAVGFVAYAVLQVATLMRSLRDSLEKTRDYAKLESELTQSRISVMLSQIKPHFLFNALNSISALCLTDPLMADQAITSLSNYLRGNIRSLEQSAPVPFQTELEQIKYYARLEQLRFGDKLQVIYAIDFDDFMVPTLSLQPLVENAIRHGLGPKPEGGTVLLHTQRVGDEAIIQIVDNGVGFSETSASGEPHTGIGLSNARERLQHIVRGTLEIESVPGEGTTLTIRIPIDKEEIA